MSDNILSLYSGKKVLITGHTGFKGSWLLAWLYSLGAEVKGYALSPENENDHFNVIKGYQICNSVIGDIRNKDNVSKEVLSFQPDFVFHLAAQPLVRLSYEIPVETFEVNILGTVNLLDAVRDLKNKCVVICITTDKVYENKEWQYPYRESDRLGGHDPYSASKAATELVISSYRDSFFNQNDYPNHQKSISSARAGNVIGGGDWSKDRLIPDLIRALTRDQPIKVRNPNSVRPWQHVLEPLMGYLTLGNKMFEQPNQFCGAWNFGPNLEDTLSVRDLVKIAFQKYGSGRFETPQLANQYHEAILLKLDINKTIYELGWKPKWNAEKAIEETVNWYTGAKDTFTQILEYSKT